MTRERISRPYLSRPQRCVGEGCPLAKAASLWVGLYGAIHGASRATPTHKSVISTPMRKRVGPANACLTVARFQGHRAGSAGNRRTCVLLCAVAIAIPIHAALAG